MYYVDQSIYYSQAPVLTGQGCPAGFATFAMSGTQKQPDQQRRSSEDFSVKTSGDYRIYVNGTFARPGVTSNPSLTNAAQAATFNIYQDIQGVVGGPRTDLPIGNHRWGDYRYTPNPAVDSVINLTSGIKYYIGDPDGLTKSPDTFYYVCFCGPYA